MATYGYTFQSGDGVTPTRLNDARTISAIVNADLSDDTITNAKIKSDAAIAFSKLAALDSANILVGNGSNVATKVAVTGDVTISNAGVTAIGSAKVLPAMLSQPYTLAAAQASTSGTAIDFTGIPSWAKRITVVFSEVSTNGNNDVLVQLGDSGGFETTGYVSTTIGVNNTSGTAGTNRTDGLVISYSSASVVLTGHMNITKIDGNSWVSSHNAKTTAASITVGGGSKTLSDVLTQVRITTVGGTNTFDAGTVNVSYE